MVTVIHRAEAARYFSRAAVAAVGHLAVEAAAGSAGLAVEVIERHGNPDVELAELAKDVDSVLVGRRGRSSPAGAVGATVASLIRIAQQSVIQAPQRIGRRIPGDQPDDGFW